MAASRQTEPPKKKKHVISCALLQRTVLESRRCFFCITTLKHDRCRLIVLHHVPQAIGRHDYVFIALFQIPFTFEKKMKKKR
jgi:hypothetical protein